VREALVSLQERLDAEEFIDMEVHANAEELEELERL
jgi:hypothetical protein